MASVKTCFKCLSVKPLAEFYRHPMMADGHLGKCKECTKRDVMEHRERNLERIRAYDAMRSQLPHRKAALFKRSDPARTAVAKVASAAVKRGILKRQPCHICGAEKVEAHHTHYSHPLEVVWLCRSHHVQLHRQFSLWKKEQSK